MQFTIVEVYIRLGLGYSVITSIKVYILHHSLKVRVRIGRLGKYIA